MQTSAPTLGPVAMSSKSKQVANNLQTGQATYPMKQILALSTSAG